MTDAKSKELIKLYLELIDRFIKLVELGASNSRTLDLIGNRIRELDIQLFKSKIIHQDELSLPKKGSDK